MPAPDTATLVDLWHRLGMAIRLGLAPDDPRLIARYLICGQALREDHGMPPWQLTERMLRLLVDSANDGCLPLLWRMACLEAGHQTIQQLGRLARSGEQHEQLLQLARRFAQFDCGHGRSTRHAP